MIGKHHEYKAMAACERELWWYVCLHHLTIQKIKKYSKPSNVRILDAGCGTGGMLSYLIDSGISNISGFDLSEDAVHFAKNNFHFEIRMLNILACDTAYDQQSFDIIISHDVLCLLNDREDRIALNKLVSLLKPGGFIFMNLPAGNAFKGTHDIAVGIKKRYSLESVKELSSEVIEIKEFLYWPFMLSPIIFTVRLFQRVKMFFRQSNNSVSDVALPYPLLNKFFRNITKWENSFFDTKPWGSSIFLVMQNVT